MFLYRSTKAQELSPFTASIATCTSWPPSGVIQLPASAFRVVTSYEDCGKRPAELSQAQSTTQLPEHPRIFLIFGIQLLTKFKTVADSLDRSSFETKRNTASVVDLAVDRNMHEAFDDVDMR